MFLDLEDKYGCHNYSPLPAVIAKAERVYMWDCEGIKFTHIREKIFWLLIRLFSCESGTLPSKNSKHYDWASQNIDIDI